MGFYKGNLGSCRLLETSAWTLGLSQVLRVPVQPWLSVFTMGLEPESFLTSSGDKSPSL